MQFAPGAWRFAGPPLIAAVAALFGGFGIGSPRLGLSGGVIGVALSVAVLVFFRDPDRETPATGVVSPADGNVSVIREEIVDGERRVRLGVFMNVWHVHVVRAPFDGVVAAVEHVPGAHRPAFSKDSDRNERVHVQFEPVAADVVEADGESIDDEDSSIRREVTLIAGAFARRIHPYVEPGEALGRGDRIGHIAFGSRVDVLFPPQVDPGDVEVAVGDRVTAGETVVCRGARLAARSDVVE